MASSALTLTVGLLTAMAALLAYLFHRPPLPKNAPALTREAYPIIGSLGFFTRRWDWFQQAQRRSPTDNFSFYTGNHPIIAVAGIQGRKAYFESKHLSLGEGYQALLGGSPTTSQIRSAGGQGEEEYTSDFTSYFARRLAALLKGPQLKLGLPRLISDVRKVLDELAAAPERITDPYDSIYQTVFQLTIRTVGCTEMADDPATVAKCLQLYEVLDSTASPWAIMYPWLPLWSKVNRYYAGAQLYMLVKRIMDRRKASGTRHEDPLQFLMDQGDSPTDVITFIIGSLFAGILNSGINAAAILTYLAAKPYWLDQVFEEVNGVASRYCPDETIPLKDRLMEGRPLCGEESNESPLAAANEAKPHPLSPLRTLWDPPLSISATC